MKEINISDLIGIWFHDVIVNRLIVDYVTRQVEMEFVIPVGFWNSPNRYDLTEGEVTGTLVFTGLLYFVAEPPHPLYPYENRAGIDITSDGTVTEEQFPASVYRMPRELPDDAFLHYFFVNDWNSFIFVAATGASLRLQ